MIEFNCLMCQHKVSSMIHSRIRDNENISVLRCEGCDLVQLHPLPSEEDLINFYQADSQAKNAQMPSDREEIWERTKVDNLRRWGDLKDRVGAEQNILEIGSGYGSFLRAAHKDCHDSKIELIGHEFSAPRRKIAENYAKVYSDFELKDIPEDKNFDFVLSYHVLEHVLDLEVFLNNIKRLCTQKTVIILEVPNAHDEMTRLSKEYADFFYQSAHLIYWSKDTLHQLLSSNGFDSISIRGVQRYGEDNHQHWLKNKSPLYQPLKAADPENKSDGQHRKRLIANMSCDTLSAECRIA